jgi:outer membrane receptor protein involved in Fe transport
MRLWGFSLTLLFVFSQTLAQTKQSLVEVNQAFGKVIDSSNLNILSFASVSIKKNGSENFLSSTITNINGDFNFQNLPKDKYILVISYLGYEAQTHSFSITNAISIDLGKISLTPSSTQLQEVQVVAERFMIEQDVDKLIYHVDMDPDSDFLNALEMLGKIPHLSLDGNNNLQLNGSDSYDVMINGRTSSLFIQNPSEVFRTIPANTIKSIEVITNPPARYDAEGVGGIINIITYRKTISGYNGSLTSSLSSPAGGSLGSQINLKSGKIGISAMGVYNLNTSPTASRNFIREDMIRNTLLEQRGENKNSNHGYNWGGELTYDISPLTQITASFRTNNRIGSSFFFQEVEMINASGEMIQAYTNQNKGTNSFGSRDMGLDLHRGFKNNSARQLTMSYRLGRNTMDNFSEFEVDAVMNHIGRMSQTENDNQTLEHNFQADYVHPFRKKQKLEIGVKSNLRNNRSEYFYKNLDQDTQEYLIVDKLSNQFHHQQDIHAAYASLHLNMNSWSVRLGVRGELTYVNANFYTSDTAAAMDYLNYIPNLSLVRKFKRNSTVRGSYTQRLERPGLWHLNPYIDLTDPRNISYGNPNLDPATNHSFNLAYSSFFKKSSINAQFFHYFANNSIQQYTSLREDTVAHTTFGNVGKRKVYGFSLGSNATLGKKFTININSTSQYAELTRMIREQAQTNAGLTINASANIGYRMNKSWRFTGNLGYTSPQILLQGRSASFLSNNISINKQFMGKHNGNFSLAVSNPFQHYRRFQNEVNDPFFRQVQESFAVIRQYTFSFNYQFGKVQAGQSRKRTTSTVYPD